MDSELMACITRRFQLHDGHEVEYVCTYGNIGDYSIPSLSNHEKRWPNFIMYAL